MSNNSIINQAISAKESQEIAKDKEIIKLSSDVIIMDNVVKGREAKMYRDDGNRLSIEQEIKNNGYDVKVELITEEENIEYIFKVKFNESGRVYHVKPDGTAIKVEDEGSGLSSKDGILPFIEENGTYAIYKIEDLVELSNKVNNDEETEMIMAELMNNLDFEDPNSYYDKDRTDFGDLNGDGILKGLMVELTERTNSPNEGFIPIGHKYVNIDGNGTCKMYAFDGNEKKIDNLYIKTNKYDHVGLFGCITNCEYLTVSGEINVNNKENVSVGGIAGYAQIMQNVTNKTNINASNVNSSCIAGVAGDFNYETHNVRMYNLINNSVINIEGNNNYIAGIYTNRYYNSNCDILQLQNLGEIHIKGNENICGGVISDFSSRGESNTIVSVSNRANIYLDANSSMNIVGGLFGNVNISYLRQAENYGIIEDNGDNSIGSLFSYGIADDVDEADIQTLNIRSYTEQQCAELLSRIEYANIYNHEGNEHHFYNLENPTGICEWCGDFCNHTWREISASSSFDYQNQEYYHRCAHCNIPEEHNWDGYGQCETCHYACNHEWQNGICEKCGYQCIHVMHMSGRCDICGFICNHENIEENEYGGRWCRDCGMTLDY